MEYSGSNLVKILFILTAFLTVFFNQKLYSQEKLKYQFPPKEMVDIIDAPITPSISINPSGNWMLLLDRPTMPPIEELAQPELRIAGIRLNPKTNSESRSNYFVGMKIQSIDGKNEFYFKNLPQSPKIADISYSPDGNKIGFTLTKSNGIELWYADIEAREAKKLTEAILNNSLSRSYQWLSDSKRIIFSSIDNERGAAPQILDIPEGPIIQENLGKKAPVRTYQDLLKNAKDEALFEYYTTSQINMIDLSGKIKKIGEKGIISEYRASPNGAYIIISKIKKPFSYLLPYDLFPKTTEVWDINGNVIKIIADLPLADDIPTAAGSTRKGRRSVFWRSDAPAELYFIEAQDEGNANKNVNIRDNLYSMLPPFSGEPKLVTSLNYRFSGMIFGNENLAIINERWIKNRKLITSIFDPSGKTKEKKILFDRSYEDAYSDPGNFVTTPNIYGEAVLLEKDKDLFLFGQGVSKTGVNPFVDKFDLKKLSSKRLWQSKEPYYEFPVRITDIKKELIVISRESIDEPANYYLKNLKNGDITQITKFPHPYPQYKNIYKEIVKYKRKDGVELSGTLYLPPNYKKDHPLPVLMWAYPQEFKSSAAAGQVKESPYTFNRINGAMLFLTQDYAIFDNPAMPIIGEGDKEPNDTYLEQLVSNAEAAIDKLVDMGIADRKKIAIGGHSYGAFMTANLLAHSNLFAAGIARSGAYNRTLTPFGFQSEDRSIWEAPETYIKMSPFMYASKLKTPILLIHGEADNNSGTFPIQTERFYAALKGNGGLVRYVVLPAEAHGYRARESVLHTLWEMNTWLEKYVKNKN